MLRMAQKRQKTLLTARKAFPGEAWKCGGAGFRQKKDLTLAGLALTFTLLCGNSAAAQIVPDATLGAERSAVTPIDGQIDRIDGGAIRGANLFHSFREFNIGEGRGVYFSNPAQIQNILTRITGTNASNIFGTLGVLGNANLFLINANGIIFGPNAQLDLRGSFLASTASSIKFPDSTEFSATNPQAPALLTINVPVGLQFGASPGKIVNQAAAIDSNGFLVGLQVQPGKSLVLAGGDITLTGGGLSAVGGRIELGGLAGAGTVGLTAQGNTFRLSFPENSQLANVTLTDNARVSVRGEGGGDIAVSANTFTASGGGGLIAGTEGAGNGGDITVNAKESVELIGTSPDGKTPTSLLTSSSSSVVYTYPGPGAAGDVRIVTRRLAVRDGAVIEAATAGEGAAGNITVTASESVELTGSSPTRPFDSFSLFIPNGGLYAFTSHSGKAGNITITTGKLTVRDGSQISAATTGSSGGDAGSVSVRASDVELSGSTVGAQSQEGSGGNAGNVTVNTGRLTVRDGAQISAESFLGAGNGGSVSVSASDVELIGTSADGFVPSRLTTSVTGDYSRAQAGTVTVNTERLTVRDGAQISAGTFGSADAGSVTVNASDVELIGTSADGKLASSLTVAVRTIGKAAPPGGAPGNVTVNTERLTVRDGAEISAEMTGRGNAGSVIVNATDVELIGIRARNSSLPPSNLNARSGDGATGNAGTVTVNTQHLTVRDGAQISADSYRLGDAGSVSVSASDVELIGTSGNGWRSGLSAVARANGNGGTVTVDTQRLTVRDGAEISAGTGAGDPGSVSVRASDVELIGTAANGAFSSRLSAAVAVNRTGDVGNVTVDTNRLTVREGATITVSNQRLGDAGNLKITAGDILLDTQGSLTATSETGKGGNISLEAQNIQLRNASEISAAGSKTGNITLQGNISIKADTFVLQEGSRLIPSASDPGGGSTIISPLGESDAAVFKSADSTISEVGQLTVEGAVRSRPAEVLPVKFTDITGLIKRRCSPETLQESRLTVPGTGELPPAPTAAPGSQTVLLEWGAQPAPKEPNSDSSQAEIPKSPNPGSSLVEAQGWAVSPTGEVILTTSPGAGTPGAPVFPPPPGCP